MLFPPIFFFIHINAESKAKKKGSKNIFAGLAANF
jgi:hypothetical protein